jgi:hypothetical protein
MLAFAMSGCAQPEREPARIPFDADFEAPLLLARRSERPLRPIYRFSIVRGGTYSATELHEAAQTDSAVGRHYDGMAFERVQATTVTEPRRVHVSYRVGNQIYWTKHKVTLKPGEATLTDGKFEVRARCGNGISDRPMLPTLEDEPDISEFDRVVSSPDSELESTPGAPFASMLPDTSGVLGIPGDASTTGFAGEPIGAGPPAGTIAPLGEGTPIRQSTADDPSESRLYLPSDGSWPEFAKAPSDPGRSLPESNGALPIALPDGTLLIPVPKGRNIPVPHLDTPGFPTETLLSNPALAWGANPDPPLPVPEPATILLVGGGIGVVIARRLRRKKTPNSKP